MEYADAPIKEPFIINGKLSPSWQKYFSRIVDPILKAVDDSAPSVPDESYVLANSTVNTENFMNMVEAFIYSIMVQSQSADLLKRIEQLEKTQNINLVDNNSLLKRVEELERQVFIPNDNLDVLDRLTTVEDAIFGLE